MTTTPNGADRGAQYDETMTQIQDLTNHWGGGSRTADTAERLSRAYELAAYLVEADQEAGAERTRHLPPGTRQDLLTFAAKWARAVV